MRMRRTGFALVLFASVALAQPARDLAVGNFDSMGITHQMELHVGTSGNPMGPWTVTNHAPGTGVPLRAESADGFGGDLFWQTLDLGTFMTEIRRTPSPFFGPATSTAFVTAPSNRPIEDFAFDGTTGTFLVVGSQVGGSAFIDRIDLAGVVVATASLPGISGPRVAVDQASGTIRIAEANGNLHVLNAVLVPTFVANLGMSVNDLEFCAQDPSFPVVALGFAASNGQVARFGVGGAAGPLTTVPNANGMFDLTIDNVGEVYFATNTAAGTKDLVHWVPSTGVTTTFASQPASGTTSFTCVTWMSRATNTTFQAGSTALSTTATWAPVFVGDTSVTFNVPVAPFTVGSLFWMLSAGPDTSLTNSFGPGGDVLVDLTTLLGSFPVPTATLPVVTVPLPALAPSLNGVTLFSQMVGVGVCDPTILACFPNPITTNGMTATVGFRPCE